MSATLDARTFPLRGSQLIEASAGTGKTYTIALLYVRLVLGHGDQSSAFTRPLLPPDILVVTFTDAASQELRDRIRARLSEAADIFSGIRTLQEGDPLAFILADYPPDQRPACALKLQRAAEWMDEAAISTIHSWCYRMLREHAFDSNSLFTQELVTDQSDLLIEIAEDYWRKFFYGMDQAAAGLLHSKVPSPDELLESVRPLLHKSDSVPVFRGVRLEPVSMPLLLQGASEYLTVYAAWEAERDALENKARAAWAADLAGIETLLAPLWPQLNGQKYTSGIKPEILLAQLQSWSVTGGRTGIDKKLFYFAEGNFQLKKGYSEQPQHRAFKLLALLKEWEDRKPPEPETFHALVLLHAAQWIGDALQQRLEQRAELGFNELLLRLDKALAGESGHHLAAAIRAQFPVAMIDEFQDTDPVQYRIFNRIYRVASNDLQTALVMIGDPKQAIYAFRGADIYTYLQARRDTAGRHYTLGINHRSTAAAVNVVNHLFAFAEQHVQGAFRFKRDDHNPVPFLPVAAKGRGETLIIDGVPANAVTGWMMPGEGQGCVVGPPSYRHGMAEAAASEIVRWLNLARLGKAGFRDNTTQTLTALKPADIAILVRTGKEAALIRHALGDRGVRSVYLSDKDSVFASTQARDMLYWLQAVAEPGNDRLLRTALATAALGLSLAALQNILADEAQWEITVMRFRAYREQWQKHGVLPMLYSLMRDYRVSANALHRADGERDLTNLLHIAEWLQQASGQLDGEQALIRHLAEQIAHPTEEQVLRLESDADLIKVVTIHKSKGLEYPLVLLPFICSSRKLDGNTRVITYHTASGETGAEMEYASWMELAGSSATDSYAVADHERLSEDMRLLYVALTRARHGLWLGIAPLAAASHHKKTALHESGLGYLLNGGAVLTEDTLQQQLASLAIDGLAVEALPVSNRDLYAPDTAVALGSPRYMPPERTIAEHWWIASYSALKTGALDDVGDVAEGNSLAGLSDPESSQQATVDEELGAENTFDSVNVPATFSASLDIHGFPRGPTPGTFLHGLLEWGAQEGFAQVLAQHDARKDFIARCCNRRGWEKWILPLDSWMQKLLGAALPAGQHTIQLHTVQRCIPEMEFWFGSDMVNTVELDRLVNEYTLNAMPRPQLLPNLLNGMLKGFIDLVFEFNGQYFVADWKSNWLGTDASAYTADAMCDAVLEKRYELQYTLYLLALHRHLQDRLADYDYDKHIGGAVYVFLRGIDNDITRGIHFEKPARALIESLDKLFAGSKERAA